MTQPTNAKRGRRPRIQLPMPDQLWKALVALRKAADNDGHLRTKPGMANIVYGALSGYGASKSWATKVKQQLEALGLLQRHPDRPGYLVDLTVAKLTATSLKELQVHPLRSDTIEAIPTLDQQIEELIRLYDTMRDERDAALAQVADLERQLNEDQGELEELRMMHLRSFQLVTNALSNNSNSSTPAKATAG